MFNHRARLFHVPAELTDQTVASVVRRLWPGATWSDARKLIRSRHVTLNGNLCLDGGRRLRSGEVLKLLEHPTAPLPREDDVRVRFLDAHLVIVEKPAGLTSTRHTEEQGWSQKRKQIQPTLEDLLPRVIAKKAPTSKKPHRDSRSARASRQTRTTPVRPVHRLDRDTSGLMVFARTVAAERDLGAQFRQHTTYRRYLAVARGVVEERTFDSYLVRDRGDGRRGGADREGIGKRAVTHVRPLERISDYTLLECRLETGRTHQIRIHLAEAGHPLCGETVYHQPKFGDATRDPSQAPRIALHAAELGVRHPATGEELRFRMELPRDLAEFIERLRKDAGRERLGDSP